MRLLWQRAFALIYQMLVSHPHPILLCEQSPVHSTVPQIWLTDLLARTLHMHPNTPCRNNTHFSKTKLRDWYCFYSCLSVHRGSLSRVLCPGVSVQGSRSRGLCLWVFCPGGGISVWGFSVTGGSRSSLCLMFVCPEWGISVPWGFSFQGGLCLGVFWGGGSLSRGSLWGSLFETGVSVQGEGLYPGCLLEWRGSLSGIDI